MTLILPEGQTQNLVKLSVLLPVLVVLEVKILEIALNTYEILAKQWN